MDVFFVGLPAPERIPELVPMPSRETPWGVAEENRYLWSRRIVGRLLELRLSDVDRLPPRFRGNVRGWRELEIAREAYRAHDAAEGRLEPLDLAPILLRILASQDDWIVCCIRDFDQRPVEYTAMTPEEVVRRVGQLLAWDASVSDIVAWRR